MCTFKYDCIYPLFTRSNSVIYPQRALLQTRGVFFFLVLLYQYVLLVVTLFAWVCEHPLEHGKVTSGHILK